jgi:predicted class III extradiol MEMO1 family dioxygenase
MDLKGTREASHAGSWYTGDKAALSVELGDYLEKVPAQLDGEDLPVSGARLIIAP